MPWLCVNKDGTELIFNDVKTPIRNKIIKEWVQWSFPTEYDKIGQILNCLKEQ